MTETPTSFEQIDPDVLRRQAVEDWAVEVKPADSLKKVIKALDDAGIDWDIYAEKYGHTYVQDASDLDAPSSVQGVEAPPAAPPRTAPAPETNTANRVPEPQRAGDVVTFANMQAGTEALPTAPQVVMAPQAPAIVPGVQYIVKMERPNTRYTHGKYTWTRQHPYCLVDAADFERILRHEPGFRQAYPCEAAEFYS